METHCRQCGRFLFSVVFCFVLTVLVKQHPAVPFKTEKYGIIGYLISNGSKKRVILKKINIVHPILSPVDIHVNKLNDTYPIKTKV